MSTAAERSKLFLPGQGENDSPTFVDLSAGGKTLTVYGNARIRTNLFKYYGSSIFFDGDGDSIFYDGTGTPVLGSNLFTVQGWIYIASGGYGNGFNFFDCRTASDDTTGFSFYVRATGKLTFARWTTGFVAVEGPTNVPLNEWVHIAVTRDASGIVRTFLNGVLQSSLTVATDYSRVGWHIGNIFNRSGVFVPGYMNDLEVSPGICLYESAFTPPGPLVGFKMSGTVKDASNNPLSRVVRACRVAGLNVQETTSDPVTGEWELWVPNEPHSVWCIGEFGESDKIFGNVYPVTG